MAIRVSQIIPGKQLPSYGTGERYMGPRRSRRQVWGFCVLRNERGKCRVLGLPSIISVLSGIPLSNM